MSRQVTLSPIDGSEVAVREHASRAEVDAALKRAKPPARSLQAGHVPQP